MEVLLALLAWPAVAVLALLLLFNLVQPLVAAFVLRQRHREQDMQTIHRRMDALEANRDSDGAKARAALEGLLKQHEGLEEKVRQLDTRTQLRRGA